MRALQEMTVAEKRAKYREYQKNYYEKNKEKAKAYQRNYNKLHRKPAIKGKNRKTVWQGIETDAKTAYQIQRMPIEKFARDFKKLILVKLG